MDQPTVRKTFKYTLAPTPTQERELGRVLGLCRLLYNTASEQRIIAWQRCSTAPSQYQQAAELKDIRAATPEHAAVQSHVLQHVLARLDKTYQAFFRRVKAGLPRYQGRMRWHLLTCMEYGNGAGLDNGFLVLSKSGRIAVRWSRPLEGAPKTATISWEPAGWYACFSCADAPIRPLPEAGQETGIDLGIEAFATLSDGTRSFSPGWYHQAERALKTAQPRVARCKKGSNRRREAIALLARSHQKDMRQRQDFRHKTALALVQNNDTIYHEDLQSANMVRNHYLAKSIQDYPRRGPGGVPKHPELLGSIHRSLSRRCAVCLRQPDLFWLRRGGLQGVIRPLALESGPWNAPPSRPQRGNKHRKVRAEPP
jgi:putative transposase